jgi:hypothetical protein
MGIIKDQTVRIWDLKNGECLASYPANSKEAKQVMGELRIVKAEDSCLT